MDYRRDGQNDQHQTEPSHTEQQNTENQKLIGHSEQELLDAPVSYEAGLKQRLNPTAYSARLAHTALSGTGRRFR